MTNIRAMAIFQGQSGLPADVFVNTFHFVGAGTPSEDQILASTAVEQFYGSIAPGQNNMIGRFLSAWVQRPYIIKTYDMTQPLVRVPTVFQVTLPAVLSANGPPEEVAVCLSLHGSVPPASPRRRGRIFLGPLCDAAVNSATVSNRSSVSSAMIFDLSLAAMKLASTALLTWSIRSITPSENYVPIVGGYIDDALDTQRRRGPDTTQRTVWFASA